MDRRADEHRVERGGVVIGRVGRGVDDRGLVPPFGQPAREAFGDLRRLFLARAVQDEVGCRTLGTVDRSKSVDAYRRLPVVSHDCSWGESLVDEFGTESGEISFHRPDLATQDVTHPPVETRVSYDRFDTLVHNAGLSTSERIATADVVEGTVAVNSGRSTTVTGATGTVSRS